MPSFLPVILGECVIELTSEKWKALSAKGEASDGRIQQAVHTSTRCHCR